MLAVSNMNEEPALVEKSLRVYVCILQIKKVQINLMHDKVEDASMYVQERYV